MTHGRKPRQVRWSPWVNTMATVKARVALITTADLADVMDPIDKAFTAMRQAVGSEMDWAHLCSAINVAQGVEKQGIVRGIYGHLHAAELALQAIKQRAMTQPTRMGNWAPVELHIDEIEIIKEAILLHKYQLKKLSTGEAMRAINYAQAEVRSTGGTVLQAPATTGPQPQAALFA